MNMMDGIAATASSLASAQLQQSYTLAVSKKAMESQELAAAVRKKGKDLAGYIAATADSGWKHRVIVDKRIVNKTKEVKKIIGTHEFAIGIPDRKTRRELARAYYLEVTE